MNVLKNKIILYGFRWLPAVSQYKICDKMRPYLKNYRLHLTEKEILFPEKMTFRQYMEIWRYAEQYLTGIPYRNIVIIGQERGGTSLYLRTGHVFTLTPDGTIPEIINVFPVKHTRLCRR